MRVACLPLMAAGSAWLSLAQAAAPTRIPVHTTASTYVELVAVDVALAAGDNVLLTTGPLTLKSGNWGDGTPTNIGATTRIRCTLNGASVLNVHYGENTTVTQWTQNPLVRGLLSASAAGSYRCAMEVSAYSTEAANGMYLRVLGAPELSVLRLPAAATWGNAGDQAVTGAALKFMSTTTPVAPAQGMTARADVQFDNNGAPGSIATITAWIEMQGLNADGSACGARYQGPKLSLGVVREQHHRTFNLDATAFINAACSAARTSVWAQQDGTQPVVVRGGLNYSHAIVNWQPQ